LELDKLKWDQRRAHDVITHHLNAYLTRQHLIQLLMLTQGAGGTGKTTVIEQITKTFRGQNAEGMLAKTATTGVTASLIEGMTLHS
ncbi:hypothetical protein L208DRAFT_1124837, partial [Tricholoma matsutake]